MSLIKAFMDDFLADAATAAEQEEMEKDYPNEDWWNDDARWTSEDVTTVFTEHRDEIDRRLTFNGVQEARDFVTSELIDCTKRRFMPRREHRFQLRYKDRGVETNHRFAIPKEDAKEGAFVLYMDGQPLVGLLPDEGGLWIGTWVEDEWVRLHQVTDEVDEEETAVERCAREGHLRIGGNDCLRCGDRGE